MELHVSQGPNVQASIYRIHSQEFQVYILSAASPVPQTHTLYIYSKRSLYISHTLHMYLKHYIYPTHYICLKRFTDLTLCTPNTVSNPLCMNKLNCSHHHPGPSLDLSPPCRAPDRGVHGLGRIELTVKYGPRNNLIIVVHRVM